MDHYAGIDVSLESSSVCVVNASGKIVREAKVASELSQSVFGESFFAAMKPCSSSRREKNGGSG